MGKPKDINQFNYCLINDIKVYVEDAIEEDKCNIILSLKNTLGYKRIIANINKN